LRLDELISGNDIVQRHVAEERAKEALLVSSYAREAVEREILPQIEEGVSSPSTVDELCDSTKAAIEQAFRAKNQVYTRLISYKSIDQGDSQYLNDLLAVLDEWGRRTRETLTGGADDDAVKLKSEVGVKVKNDAGVEVEVINADEEVESEEVDDDPPYDIRNLGAPAADEEVPLADDQDFDLGDVRL